MFRAKLIVALFLAFIITAGCADFGNQSAEQDMATIEQGRYLVMIMGCNDCHTSDAIGSRNYGPEEDWLVGGVRGFSGPYGTVYPANRYLGPKGEPAPKSLPPGVMPTTDFIPFPLPH
jgi:mono/diheme cytochrome c family protein